MTGRGAWATFDVPPSFDGLDWAFATSDFCAGAEVSARFHQALLVITDSHPLSSATGLACPVATLRFCSGAGGPTRFLQPPPSAANSAAVSLIRAACACTT